MTSPDTESTPAPEPQSRRGFLATLGGLSALWIGAMVYPVYRYLAPRKAVDPFAAEGRVKVDKITSGDVAQVGQGKNGGYAGRGLIVLRGKDGKLRAFDSKCTHAGCNVAFAGAHIECPCHGGIYDLNGKNVSGPPPSPLNELSVSEENGILYVGRPSGMKKV